MTPNVMTERDGMQHVVTRQDRDSARRYAGEAAIALFVIGLVCCSIGFLVGLAGA
jgi:hypothetical protein